MKQLLPTLTLLSLSFVSVAETYVCSYGDSDLLRMTLILERVADEGEGQFNFLMQQQSEIKDIVIDGPIVAPGSIIKNETTTKYSVIKEDDSELWIPYADYN